MKRTQLLGATLAAIVMLGTFVPHAHAAPPPTKLGPRPVWGACGLTAASSKPVFTYGYLKLQCGPWRERTFGYNHIKANHKSQFRALAAPAGRTWEDLLHFSTLWIAYDADAFRVNRSNDKACKSRALYLRDKAGRTVSTKVYKLIYVYSTGRIITVFPTTLQCRDQDVQLKRQTPH